MDDLFSVHAPAYWAKGIPVMPLQVREKKAFIDQWTQYKDSMPSELTQQSWLGLYKANNIGVPLGPQSQMVAIDIDALDPAVEKVISETLPKSPWKRVGEKGCVYVYRYNGEKTENIYDENGAMVVQLLSAGAQIVLPPSIHPKTQAPYVENVPLLSVWDSLPMLPENVIQRLRAALSGVIKLGTSSKNSKTGTFRLTDVVSVGGRDNAMTVHAGTLASAIVKGEISLSRALLVMTGWCENMTVALDGDHVDMQKGLNKIIEFLRKDIERGWILPPLWDEDLTPEDKVALGLNFDDDVLEWTQLQLNDYIVDEFNKCTSPTDPRRHEIVKYVLDKLSKSPNLRPTEIDQILTTMQKTSGLDIPVASYKRELKNLSNGPVQGENHTEIAKATKELFMERRGELRFHQGTFWCWRGNRWEEVNSQALWQIISEEFGTLLAAKKSTDHKGIIEVLKNTIPQELTAIKQEGINFANGFLTKELKLLPHAPEQGMTYVLDCEYKEELAGKCPKFFQYLDQCWGHHDDCFAKISALQEAMAVTIFGLAPSYQRAFLLYGLGGTGKSVMLQIIDRLVPPEAKCAIPPHQWHDNFSVSMLSNKLLNIAGELDKKKKINGSMFKSIISGEKIQTRSIYKSPFVLMSTAANWFASNDLPMSDDTSNGFNRRWLIFTFDKMVDAENKILDYGKVIAQDEQEAIIAWAIDGMKRLLVNKEYTLPSSHFEALNKMSLRNSPVRQWVYDNIENKEGNEVPEKALFHDFWNYCAANVIGKPIGHADFKIELQQLLSEEKRFYITHGKSGDMYHNIAIKKKNG